MELEATALPEVKLVKPRVFGDNRGFFFELYRQQYTELGLDSMVQANISRSTRGVLRGLHYQMVQPQTKLISVIRGEIFDVAVDVRQGSPNFGKWVGYLLNDTNHHQLYVPKGFAHGFCVLSEEADIIYQCSDYWHQPSEVGIRWDDPDLAIDWPMRDVVLSPKDAKNVRLAELPPDKLPVLPLTASGSARD